MLKNEPTLAIGAFDTGEALFRARRVWPSQVWPTYRYKIIKPKNLRSQFSRRVKCERERAPCEHNLERSYIVAQEFVSLRRTLEKLLFGFTGSLSVIRNLSVEPHRERGEKELPTAAWLVAQRTETPLQLRPCRGAFVDFTHPEDWQHADLNQFNLWVIQNKTNKINCKHYIYMEE